MGRFLEASCGCMRYLDGRPCLVERSAGCGALFRPPFLLLTEPKRDGEEGLGSALAPAHHAKNKSAAMKRSCFHRALVRLHALCPHSLSLAIRSAQGAQYSVYRIEVLILGHRAPTLLHPPTHRPTNRPQTDRFLTPETGGWVEMIRHFSLRPTSTGATRFCGYLEQKEASCGVVQRHQVGCRPPCQQHILHTLHPTTPQPQTHQKRTSDRKSEP